MYPQSVLLVCVQIRKQQKDHAELIEDYRTKHPQRGLQQQPAPPLPQKLLSQPVVPLQPHPGGPAPARLPNVPPGWTPGGGAPGRMPPHQPPQLPAALPNSPQVPPHTQAPSAIVPGLAAQTAGFTAAPRGPSGAPTGGPNGATVDGAGPAPQVTNMAAAPHCDLDLTRIINQTGRGGYLHMFEPPYLHQHRRPHRKFSLVDIWMCHLYVSLNICVRKANEGVTVVHVSLL